MDSLRGLQQASGLEKVQKRLKLSRASLGSLSEASRVFDAALLQPIIFNRIVAAPSSYVCRLRDNSAYEVVEERPLTDADRAAGILSDQIVRFANGKAEARPGHPIRLAQS